LATAGWRLELLSPGVGGVSFRPSVRFPGWHDSCSGSHLERSHTTMETLLIIVVLLSNGGLPCPSRK
jgi:hypothetical protein